jgi:hypothetical protein
MHELQPLPPPELESIADGPPEVLAAAEAVGWLEGTEATSQLLELLRIRPREREAAVRRALRAPPLPDDPVLLRAWRAWALNGRRT